MEWNVTIPLSQYKTLEARADRKSWELLYCNYWQYYCSKKQSDIIRKYDVDIERKSILLDEIRNQKEDIVDNYNSAILYYKIAISVLIVSLIVSVVLGYN